MSATDMECSAMKMRRLLESLPQELWDDIYKRTFTASPGGVHNLGCRKPQPPLYLPKIPGDPTPNLLAVDHESREQFAESYYTNTTFVVYGNMTLKHWLSVLPAHHRQFIKDIRLAHALGNPELVSPSSARGHRWRWIETWRYFKKTYGPGFGNQCIDAIKSGFESEVTADLPEFVSTAARGIAPLIGD